MYSIENLPTSMEIGLTGEHAFRTIDIDMSPWMELMPSGVPSIVHIRPGEGDDDAYIVATTFDSDTNVLSWTVSRSDLGTAEGVGTAQVWLEETANYTLVKRGLSATFATIIRDSIGDDSATVPAVQVPWIQQMTQLKTNTIAAALRAEAAQAAAESVASSVSEYTSQASQHASNAETYSNISEAYAKGTVDGVAVGEGEIGYHDNSKYYKEQAEAAATAAAGSATNAGNSATAAAASATAAAGSASAAQSSASSAATNSASAGGYMTAANRAATLAAGSASDAEGYAADAADSSSAAAASESNAATSETNAANSASAAATSASNAATSASNADASATLAGSHVTTAAGQANAASNSATAAAQSATAAAGSATAAANSATAAAGSATAAAQSASDAQDVLDSIPADYTTLSNQVSDLNSAFNTVSNVSAGRNLNSHINTGKWSSASSTLDFITYSPDKIVLNGTASANVAAFISDTFTLSAGDYTLTAEGITDSENVFLRLANPSASVVYGDSKVTPQFTFTEETSVRLIIWVGAGTYDLVLYPCFGTLKPYSNATLTKVVEEIPTKYPNILAGENEAVLKNGTWSSSASGISAVFDTEKTVINGTDTVNISFFITDLFTLSAGDYWTFADAINGVYVGVMNASNVALAKSTENNGAFTLSAGTQVKLFVYIYGGTACDNLTIYPRIINQTALSNADLTSTIRPFAGVSNDAIQYAVAENAYYPFACARPTDAKKAQFYDSVKNIYLFGAGADDEYYFRQVFVNSSALNPKGTYLTIYNSAGTKVCEYNGVVVPTEHQFLHFAEYNDSGITAVVEVDFTGIPDNFQPSMMLYSETGISQNCIVHPDGDVKILCPDTLYAVVGVETNLYWDACIKCMNVSNYVVEVTGNGENLGNRWHYIPVNAGTFTITIKVRDGAYRLLAVKTLNVVAVAQNASSAKTLKAIHIGDSMIDNDYHLNWLSENLSETNITYNIYGTRPHSEGRGGWTSTQYLTLASNGGVENAFYNPASNTFDFSYYMTQQGYPTPDVVFVFLGTNDIKGTTQFTGIESSTNATIKNLNTIIDSIHAYNASIKVCINTAAIGANDQWPYARMYGDNRIKQALHKAGIQMQTAKMLKTYSGRESENIFIVPTGLSLDNVNGFPTTTATASTRITKQITVQSDCYHPTSEGYHQFADCEFGFIRNVLAN